MFIQLLLTSVLFVVTVQSAVTNSSKIQSPTALVIPKQASPFDDYDLNDKNNNTAEGSGGGINLDDYADEDEDDQLSKVTATTISSTTSTTTTTTKRTTTKIPDGNSTKIADLDANEFDEDYKDDLQDDVDYNEITTKSTSVTLSSTRPSSDVHHQTPLRVLFSFLTRPPIASGILAG